MNWAHFALSFSGGLLFGIGALYFWAARKAFHKYRARLDELDHPPEGHVEVSVQHMTREEAQAFLAAAMAAGKPGKAN